MTTDMHVAFRLQHLADIAPTESITEGLDVEGERAVRFDRVCENVKLAMSERAS